MRLLWLSLLLGSVIDALLIIKSLIKDMVLTLILSLIELVPGSLVVIKLLDKVCDRVGRLPNILS
jgi:hypothetical protein